MSATIDESPTASDIFTVADLRRSLEGAPDNLRVIIHGEFLDTPQLAGLRWIKAWESLGEGKVVERQDGAERVFYIGWEDQP